MTTRAMSQHSGYYHTLILIFGFEYMDADKEKVNQLPLYDGNVTRIWLSSYSKKKPCRIFLVTPIYGGKNYYNIYGS